MTTTLYSTFSVDDRYVGIPVDRVQEVLLAQPLTPVPLAHAHISGLLNLRGQIVTAIDLRARLGLPARDADAPCANVIVTTDDGPLALLVDRLGDVIPVDDTAFEPPPTPWTRKRADRSRAPTSSTMPCCWTSTSTTPSISRPDITT